MDIKIIPVNLGFVKAFLVKGDKTIIVDAGLKSSTKRILAAMQANGIEPKDVSLLLVTHAHGDHTGGLKRLQDATGAPVAVHTLEAQYLIAGQSAPALLRSRIMKIMSVFMHGMKLDGVQPDVLIDGKLDLKPYGVDGYVYSTPGHSAGSVTMVVAGGDCLTGDMVGGAALPGIPGVCCDIEQLKASIAGLVGQGIKQVYTSHAGVYAIEDVLKLAR